MHKEQAPCHDEAATTVDRIKKWSKDTLQGFLRKKAVGPSRYVAVIIFLATLHSEVASSVDPLQADVQDFLYI
jgi:hypothetical protein